MAATSVLLDLPNELFPMIFQYLSAIDLLKAFSNLKSRRLEALVRPFISRLDVSKESKEWAEQYLANVCSEHDITALRLRVPHLNYIRHDKLLSRIKSMDVTGMNHEDEFSDDILTDLRQHLKKLSLMVPDLSNLCDMIGLLFKSDSQLEYLTVQDCELCVGSNDEIDTCTRLTYLSVELYGMSPIFTLIKHLPNLQELKVTVHGDECIGQPEPDINGVELCKTLRSVTFMGWIKYLSHMKIFFKVFGSSIERLSLNIQLRYEAIDGKEFEEEFLKNMPRLSCMDLNIVSLFVGADPIEIETFQSFTWQLFKPILYWYDTHIQQHMIFTLPYKYNRFAGFSNDFIENCVSNQKVSLAFKHVRTLSLLPTTPLTIDTFLYIKEVFTNITKIELTSPLTEYFAEDEDENQEQRRQIVFMSEQLLSDSNVQILSITELCISVQPPFHDYATFRRFLHLFPNLVRLELYTQPSLLDDILNHEHEDDFVKNSLTRIQQLHVTFSGVEDNCIRNKLEYLFPNVKDHGESYAYDFCG